MATPTTPYDSTVTIREETPKYVRLPDAGMGYLEEKIRSAMWWPDIGLRVQKSDGLVGVSLLKQLAMSAEIRWDEEERDYQFRYKAEVSFDMRPYRLRKSIPPVPFLSSSGGADDAGRRAGGAGGNCRHGRRGHADRRTRLAWVTGSNDYQTD